MRFADVLAGDARDPARSGGERPRRHVQRAAATARTRSTTSRGALHPQRPAPQPVPLQAADPRTQPPGSGHLEEGDPGHQPRAQQLAGADRLPGPLGAPARADPDHARAWRACSPPSRSAALHLKHFIDGYARFAKLPAPRIESVAWSASSPSCAELAPFTLEGPLPARRARFDATQMQQVLINLLKNAHESGSPQAAVTLSLRQDARRPAPGRGGCGSGHGAGVCWSRRCCPSIPPSSPERDSACPSAARS